MTPRRPVPSERWRDVASTIANSATENFAELFRVSGLDPKRHLKFADWSGVSFRDANLRGFDFTGARLLGCDFSGALIEHARFDQAEIHSAQRDLKALRPTDLRAAADWPQYDRQWLRNKRIPPDDHLPIGAVFQDAPFAPEMLIIPPGSMQSLFDDSQRIVINQPFAVSRLLVTYEQWKSAFLRGGVQHKASKPRKSDDQLKRTRVSMPVSEVSWQDAKKYASWLTKTTGKPYRLVSQAELQYCNQWYHIDPRRPTPNSLGFIFGNLEEWCDDNGPAEQFLPNMSVPSTTTNLHALAIRVSPIDQVHVGIIGPIGVGANSLLSRAIDDRDTLRGFRVARHLVN
jgi:hypothetical protein